MISLGGSGENREFVGEINVYIHFHMTTVPKCVMINVKTCMLHEMFFVFQWRRQKDI